MRRKRLGILIILFFSSWVVVSYFLFFYCPDCQKNEKANFKESNDKQMKVQLIEKQVKSLSEDYLSLVKGFKEAVKKSVMISKIKKDVGAKTDEHLAKRPWSQDVALLQMAEMEYGTKLPKATEPLSLEFQMREIASKKLENGGPVIAVLVLSCDRITVGRCLDQLLKYRPSKEQFPIIVSQDCSHRKTTDIILSFGDSVTLIKQPDQSEIPIPPKEKKFKGYFKIARHYGWALNQTFFKFKFDTAIIVEDDLDIAPDFFEYFLGTYWILKNDSTLWCVSAWNDNGKNGLIDESQPQLLYRTDFFPGLGWMLTKSLWTELSVKWPSSYWDDWIRKPEQRKDRACIRPELPRTKTFGKIGVSNGMFFEKHLKYIKLNENYVSFTKLNLSYLLKDIYDMEFVKDVYGSPVISYPELKNGQIVSRGPVRIPYYTKDQYKKTAKYMGLMDDFRSGVPRTAYRGVVTFSYKGRKVYLAPHTNWKGYDITWS